MEANSIARWSFFLIFVVFYHICSNMRRTRRKKTPPGAFAKQALIFVLFLLTQGRSG
jgi:hypothetical protein